VILGDFPESLGIVPRGFPAADSDEDPEELLSEPIDIELFSHAGEMDVRSQYPAEVSLEINRPGFEAKGKRRFPGKKEPRRGRPVNLSRCLDSCEAGGAVLMAFCNDIEKVDIRRSCFALDKESEQKCRGFCANYFGR
jgi:hypothetical protein